MGILRVNNKFDFEKKINSFCKAPQYRLEEIEPSLAMITVLDSDGIPKHPVMLRESESTVQFCIALDFEFDEIEEIPNSLSTLLLRLNGQSTTGFWSLDMDGDEEDDEEDFPMFFYNYIVPKVLLNQNRFDDAIADLAENYEFFYSLFDGFDPEFDEDDEDLDDLDEDSPEDDGNHRHEH